MAKFSSMRKLRKVTLTCDVFMRSLSALCSCAGGISRSPSRVTRTKSSERSSPSPVASLKGRARLKPELAESTSRSGKTQLPMSCPSQMTWKTKCDSWPVKGSSTRQSKMGWGPNASPKGERCSWLPKATTACGGSQWIPGNRRFVALITVTKSLPCEFCCVCRNLG